MGLWNCLTFLKKIKTGKFTQTESQGFSAGSRPQVTPDSRCSI
jgi:hypothetical protein